MLCILRLLVFLPNPRLLACTSCSSLRAGCFSTSHQTIRSFGCLPDMRCFPSPSFSTRAFSGSMPWIEVPVTIQSCMCTGLGSCQRSCGGVGFTVSHTTPLVAYQYSPIWSSWDIGPKQETSFPALTGVFSLMSLGKRRVVCWFSCFVGFEFSLERQRLQGPRR